jgi:hypothetical protein
MRSVAGAAFTLVRPQAMKATREMSIAGRATALGMDLVCSDLVQRRNMDNGDFTVSSVMEELQRSDVNTLDAVDHELVLFGT